MLFKNERTFMDVSMCLNSIIGETLKSPIEVIPAKFGIQNPPKIIDA